MGPWGRANGPMGHWGGGFIGRRRLMIKG